MDPSRIRLEDDRFGLIGISFRPRNRATYVGRDGDDHVWSIGIMVGDEDEIQTVEIDEHGAKSSRMLTPGELFEGLEILAAAGTDAYLIAGTMTLLGMDLRASSSESAHEFADVLRAAADDRGWRLPLHLIGQPRDLQLSNQGRDILRQTASAIEQDLRAQTSLSAASRLELSAQALDSIRRRISRKSLQAYRMHGRWYVVLDNLARSRTAEMNGTTTVEVPPQTAAPEPSSSPFVEAPSEAEAAEHAVVAHDVRDEEQPEPHISTFESEPRSEEAEMPSEELTAEAAVSEPEAQPETVEMEPPREAPTEDELAAFVSEEPQAEGEPEHDEIGTEVHFEQPEVPQQPAEEATAESFTSEFAAEEPEQQEMATHEEAEPEEVPAEPSELDGEPPQEVDQFISESVLEQFIVAGFDEATTTGEPEEAEEPGVEQAEEPITAAEDVITDETPEEPDAAAVSDELAEAEPIAEATEAEEPAEAEDHVIEAPAEETPVVHAEEPSEVEDVESVVGETTVFIPEATAETSKVSEEEAPASMEPEETAREEMEPSATSAVEETAGEEEAAVEEPEILVAAAESSEIQQEGVEVEEEAPAPPVADEADVLEEPVSAETGEQAEPQGEEAEDVDIGPSETEAEDDALVAEAEEPVAVVGEEAEDVDVTGEEPTTEEAEQEPLEAEEAAGADSEQVEEPIQSPGLGEDDLDLLVHLRDEVAFLRQQGQEKDRQIVAWINGAQWLQPFVDQIRALEQQVERLGELQAKRDGERISDLVSERNLLRDRLAMLEEEIESARGKSTSVETNRRSWFRRMMGSD
jgi:hypothetical protein